MIGIYKITSPSGKIYIGQSRNINTRFNRYKNLHCSEQPKIYRSLIKYGYINHNFEIIEECLFEELNIKERYWQDYYDVIGINGLNCVLTETDELPQIRSEESRLKIVNSLTGKKRTLEQRKKMSESAKNMSDQHKLNISLAKKGKPNSESHKLKMSLVNLKKVINTETNEIYCCAKEVSILININIYTLYGYLNGTSKNKTTFKYL